MRAADSYADDSVRAKFAHTAAGGKWERGIKWDCRQVVDG